MNPQESRSRSPSLLDPGDRPPVEKKVAGRILDDVHDGSAEKSLSVRRRRWLWPSAVVALVIVAAVLLHLGNGVDATGPAPQSAADVATDMPSAKAADASVLPTHSAQQDTPGDGSKAAIILSGDAETVPISDRATMAVASSVGRREDPRASELGRVFLKPAVKAPVAAVPSRSLRASRGVHDDADVDLLTALIKHVEIEGAARKGTKHSAAAPSAIPDEMIDARLQACPEPNTEAGISCRQRICAGRTGQTEACPAALPSGA